MTNHVWKCVSSPKDRRLWRWGCDRCGSVVMARYSPIGPNLDGMTLAVTGELWSDRRPTSIPWDCDLAVVNGVMGE